MAFQKTRPKADWPRRGARLQTSDGDAIMTKHHFCASSAASATEFGKINFKTNNRFMLATTHTQHDASFWVLLSWPCSAPFHLADRCFPLSLLSMNDRQHPGVQASAPTPVAHHLACCCKLPSRGIALGMASLRVYHAPQQPLPATLRKFVNSATFPQA